MSYPGVDPSEIEETKPAETQVVSEGIEKEIHSLENEGFHVTKAEVEKVQKIDEAGNPVDPPLSDEQIRLAAEKAAAEAMKHQFDVVGWKPKQIVKFIIDCPSGQRALVKHLGPNDLINYRLMEELDLFTKLLFSAANTDHSAGTIFNSLDDPEKRLKFFDMTNRLIAVSSIKPKVIDDGCALISRAEYDAIIAEKEIPKPFGDQVVIFGHQVKDLALQARLFGKVTPELKEGEAYAGAIEFSDRLTFYQELSKPLAVIEPFREEQASVLASMETVSSTELPSKQPV